MLLPLNRLVLTPVATVVAVTRIVNDGFLDALDQLGIDDLAEAGQNTPIAAMAERILAEDETYGGSGEDLIEFGGRQCYRAWKSGRSHGEYIDNIMEMMHGSVLSHANISFLLTGISRSLSLELVRHHVGTAPSQESQRYVDAKDMRFVVPPITAEMHAGSTEQQLADCPELTLLRKTFQRDADDYGAYQGMIVRRLADTGADVKLVTSNKKRANEAARAVLPNAAETRMLFTTNLRALRHILTLRGQSAADLEIRRLAIAMLESARAHAPRVTGDMSLRRAEDGRFSIASEFEGHI